MAKCRGSRKHCLRQKLVCRDYIEELSARKAELKEKGSRTEKGKGSRRGYVADPRPPACPRYHKCGSSVGPEVVLSQQPQREKPCGWRGHS